MKTIILGGALAGLLALSACQSPLTPAQDVQLGCIGAKTGAAIAGAATSGGAAVTAGKVSNGVNAGCAGAAAAVGVLNK